MPTKREWEARIQEGPDAWPDVVAELRNGPAKQARTLVPLLLRDAWGPEVIAAVVEALPKLSGRGLEQAIDHLVSVPDDELRPGVEALLAAGGLEPAHQALLQKLPSLRNALADSASVPSATTLDQALEDLARHGLPAEQAEWVRWADFTPFEGILGRRLTSVYAVAAVWRHAPTTWSNDADRWAFRALRAHPAFDERAFEVGEREVDRILQGAAMRAHGDGRAAIEPDDLADELITPSQPALEPVLLRPSRAAVRALDLADVGVAATPESLLHALWRMRGAACERLEAAGRRPATDGLSPEQLQRRQQTDAALQNGAADALFRVAFDRVMEANGSPMTAGFDRALEALVIVARAHLHHVDVDSPGAIDRHWDSIRALWSAGGRPIGLAEALDIAHDVQKRRCARWVTYRALDALSGAFEALRRRRIATAYAPEINAQYARAEVRRYWRGEGRPKGSAFTVSADAANAVRGQGLLVYFGGADDSDAVPLAIVAALKSQGLPVGWSGNVNRAIRILPTPWEVVRPLNDGSSA
jgi:hypothetical protein